MTQIWLCALVSIIVVVIVVNFTRSIATIKNDCLNDLHASCRVQLYIPHYKLKEKKKKQSTHIVSSLFKHVYLSSFDRRQRDEWSMWLVKRVNITYKLLCISVIIIIVQRYGQNYSVRNAHDFCALITITNSYLEFIFFLLWKWTEKRVNLHTIAYGRYIFLGVTLI